LPLKDLDILDWIGWIFVFQRMAVFHKNRDKLLLEKPYNKPTKDKVTLSFAGCYDKPKVIWAGTGIPAPKPV
jgi:hypothetical protein